MRAGRPPKNPGGTYIVIHRGGVPIRFDYAGGAYVEITFGSLGYKPTEVINVWDYEAGRSTIPHTEDAIKKTAKEWMASQDEEWPEWLEEYLANR